MFEVIYMGRQDTLPRMFFDQAERFKDKTLFLSRTAEEYKGISWDEAGLIVREVAAGLMSLGIEPGDRVAVFSENRPEWAVSDLGILAAGAVSVPVYHTSTPVQAARILKKSGTRIAIVSGRERAEEVLSQYLSLERVVLVDEPEAGAAGEELLGFSVLRALGKERLADDGKKELEDRLQDADSQDCATIIYTSGTTGDPKGVMLSHSNILSNARAGLEAVSVFPEDVCLSFLPLSHVLERTIGQFLMIMAGASIAYAESIQTVAENIPEVRPSVMIGVPRFYEKFHTRIMDALRKAPAARRGMFMWALDVGGKWLDAHDSGSVPGLLLRLQHALADRLIYGKVRERLGGRIRFFISGGAPLSADITRFFLSVGIKVLEGYGLTESSPVISVNRLHKVKPGTVGPPLPGVEVRIADDGEILVRGSLVMLGYYNDPDATKEVIRDGWLHTGDIGFMDEDGYLRITDRKKDIIITSGGKNVTPQTVENLILGDEFISQVMVYGDGRKYLTALVVPDFERLADEAGKLGLNGMSPGEMARDSKVKDFLLSRVMSRTGDLSHFEQVKKIAVLDYPLTLEDGDLTPTLKIKRKEVLKKYGERLESLYLEDERQD